MIWLYVVLAISIALNIGLIIALCILKKKHYRISQQLHFYNVSHFGKHVD